MAYFVLLNERAIMCSCMYTFAMGSVCCHAIMASKMYQAMDVRPNYIHPRFLWNFKDDLIPRMMAYGFPRLYGAALDQEQQPAAGAHPAGPAPVASSRPGATSVAASQKTPILTTNLSTQPARYHVLQQEALQLVEAASTTKENTEWLRRIISQALSTRFLTPVVAAPMGAPPVPPATEPTQAQVAPSRPGSGSLADTVAAKTIAQAQSVVGIIQDPPFTMTKGLTRKKPTAPGTGAAAAASAAKRQKATAAQVAAAQP